MGIEKLNHGVLNANFTHKKVTDETYNCRVAMWQIPYDKRYGKYDLDKSSWFETINKNYNNEIENVEKDLKVSFSKFKVYTHTLEYNDNSVTEISKYPNGNNVKVIKNNNYVLIKITNKSGDLVAEKFYNYESNEGRKTIYKHIKQGNNIFTIARVFNYDTTKNKSSDVINYGYTSLDSALTKGCTLYKEYYTLNGKEVKATKISDFEYRVDENDNKIIFTED